MPRLLIDVPYDCINEVFEYLAHYRDVGRIACTCWYFYEQAQEELLWRGLCAVHLPSSIFAREAARVERNEHSTFVSWKRILQQFTKTKKIDTLVQFLTSTDSGGSGGGGGGSSHNAMMRQLLDVSFRDGGCIGTLGAANLACVLRGNTCIETLDLCGQLIRDVGLSSLAPALATCATLTRLSLANNKLTARCRGDLIQVFGEMKALVSLDLTHNPGLPMIVVREGMEVRGFDAGLTPISQLYLDGVPFTGGASEVRALLQTFLKTAVQDSSRRLLSLRSCAIPSDAAESVAEFAESWSRKCGCGTHIVVGRRRAVGEEQRTVEIPSLHLDLTDCPHSSERLVNQLPTAGKQVATLRQACASGAVDLRFVERSGSGGCNIM